MGRGWGRHAWSRQSWSWVRISAIVGCGKLGLMAGRWVGKRERKGMVMVWRRAARVEWCLQCLIARGVGVRFDIRHWRLKKSGRDEYECQIIGIYTSGMNFQIDLTYVFNNAPVTSEHGTNRPRNPHRRWAIYRKPATPPASRAKHPLIPRRVPT